MRAPILRDDRMIMAIDPRKTSQQHANVNLSEIVAVTAKLAPAISGIDMIGANADTAYFVYRGDPGTLDAVDIVLGKAIDVAATVTVKIGGVAVPGTGMPAGVITIPFAGSGPGVRASGIPTSANALADESVISLTVGGGNTLVAFADATLSISYTPAAT